MNSERLNPQYAGSQQHGVHEQQHGRLAEGPVVRVFGEGYHVSLPGGWCIRNAFSTSRSWFSGQIRPEAISRSFVGVAADVAAAVEPERRKHAIALDHRLRLLVLAGRQPVVGVDDDPQDGARLRVGPLAVGLDGRVVIERLGRLRDRTASAPFAAVAGAAPVRTCRACRTRSHLPHLPAPDLPIPGAGLSPGASRLPFFSSGLVSSRPTFSPVAQRVASASVISVPPPRSHSLSRASTRVVDRPRVVARGQDDDVEVGEVGAGERGRRAPRSRAGRTGARACSASSRPTATASARPTPAARAAPSGSASRCCRARCPRPRTSYRWARPRRRASAARAVSRAWRSAGLPALRMMAVPMG